MRQLVGQSASVAFTFQSLPLMSWQRRVNQHAIAASASLAYVERCLSAVEAAIRHLVQNEGVDKLRRRGARRLECRFCVVASRPKPKEPEPGSEAETATERERQYRAGEEDPNKKKKRLTSPNCSNC